MRYELSDSEWGIIRAMLPTKPRGYPASMIGASSMASSGYCDLALPGGTSQPSMDPAPLATIGSFAGEGPASGTGSCRR